MPVTLYLAIPCYNEAAVLPETAESREAVLALLSALPPDAVQARVEATDTETGGDMI